VGIVCVRWCRPASDAHMPGCVHVYEQVAFLQEVMKTGKVDPMHMLTSLVQGDGYKVGVCAHIRTCVHASVHRVCTARALILVCGTVIHCRDACGPAHGE
jgi:hypothetical protein